MTFADISKDADALSFTDEEVAADWKLGMVRAAARILVAYGTITKGITSSGYGGGTLTATSSDAAHAYGKGWSGYSSRLSCCSYSL